MISVLGNTRHELETDTHNLTWENLPLFNHFACQGLEDIKELEVTAGAWQGPKHWVSFLKLNQVLDFWTIFSHVFSYWIPSSVPSFFFFLLLTRKRDNNENSLVLRFVQCFPVFLHFSHHSKQNTDIHQKMCAQASVQEIGHCMKYW